MTRWPSTGAALAGTALAVTLFVVSLPFVAVRYAVVDYSGIAALGLGWLGPLGYHFGWYGNLGLWSAWGLLLLPTRITRALAVPCVALGLAVALTSFWSLSTHELWGRNTAEGSGPFQAFGPAIYLWCASFVATGLTGVASLLLDLLPTRLADHPR